jgi:hypothetical protein
MAVLYYRILPEAPTPPVSAIADAGTDNECWAYGETALDGSEESRSGDVVCSLRADHEGPHWDQWDRVSWAES